MSFVTSKLLSFLSRNRRCCAFFYTESVCWEKDRWVSISVPRYLKASTCSLVCPASWPTSQPACRPNKTSSSFNTFLTNGQTDEQADRIEMQRDTIDIERYRRDIQIDKRHAESYNRHKSGIEGTYR